VKTLADVRVGDFVVRNMCGTTMELKVTKISPLIIECGPWEFDAETGAEIDEELGWSSLRTGSFIAAKE
jgi:hypothetical protein